MSVFGIVGSGISFIKRKAASGAQFMFAGIGDRIASRCTGTKCSFGKQLVSKMQECEPWTDSFERSSLFGAQTAVQDGEFGQAKILMTLGIKEGAKGYCVNLALMAIDMLAYGSEMTVEMVPFLE